MVIWAFCAEMTECEIDMSRGGCHIHFFATIISFKNSYLLLFVANLYEPLSFSDKINISKYNVTPA
jgi:hypothetical protein